MPSNYLDGPQSQVRRRQPKMGEEMGEGPGGPMTPPSIQPFQPLPSLNPQFMAQPIRQEAGELPQADGLDKVLKMLFGVV